MGILIAEKVLLLLLGAAVLFIAGHWVGRMFALRETRRLYEGALLEARALAAKQEQIIACLLAESGHKSLEEIKDEFRSGT